MDMSFWWNFHHGLHWKLSFCMWSRNQKSREGKSYLIYLLTYWFRIHPYNTIYVYIKTIYCKWRGNDDCRIQIFNSFPPWTKWPPFCQTTFSVAFSWVKIVEFRLKFHWNTFPGVQLTISQHWFRYWLGADQATSHYLDQWWPSLLTHIFGTKGRWVNILRTRKMAAILQTADSNSFSRIAIVIFW